MEVSVGASTSQLQELQVSLQVYSSREIGLACTKVCEKNFVSFLSLFNKARESAHASPFPTKETGFMSSPLKEAKALNLPNQFNEPNVTPFAYPEERQCPNGSESNQQKSPSSGGHSNVPTHYSTPSNELRFGPPGGPSSNPSQSDDPREPGSGSDPSDPDSDPDLDEPDFDCPIGEPNCAICFYFEQRKIAIFGSKDGGRKSPDMELLFNEPVFTTQSQSSLPNVFALGSTSQQQQFATAAGPLNLPTTFASSSQSHQSIPCEEDPSSRFLLPNVRVLLLQSEESPSSSLNSEFRVPEAPDYQLQSLSQINVPKFKLSVAVSTSPLQQQRLIESGSPSNLPTIHIFNPQIQQPVHVYRSQLYQQTSSSPIPTPPFETGRPYLRSRLRVPKLTPSRPQSLATPLQQVEYLVTGGPSSSRFSSQVEQVVRPSESSSAGSVQNVRSQSEPFRGILSEPLLKVPSVRPSRLQSMDTTTPEFSSPLQQLQYFTRSRRDSQEVPRALGFSPQLQQPVRANEPKLYERRSLLKRSMTDVPSIRNILSPPSLHRDTPFQVPEVPVYEPGIKRRRTDSLPPFSVSRVRPSQALGSALQRQQYFTFTGQPRTPTEETVHSQVRQPVRASISQVYERPSLRRQSIDMPHTLIMLPRPNEPTSFETVLRVPNAMRFQRRCSITNLPAFCSALLQQQPLPFRSRLNIRPAQYFRPRLQKQVPMFGLQPYQETHSFLGSLLLPTSQRQFTITNTSGTPLKQLEVLASKGPTFSDFNSKVEQLVSDPELYDRSSSVAGSLTDVSSIRHILLHTPRESSLETRPIIPSQFRPASQQEPFLPFMGSLDISTPPVLISQSQPTVCARSIQRERSSTGSLINVPSVRAVLPQSRASEHQPKKKDPFSIATLLDLPKTQVEVPQSEGPINRPFEQKSDVPRVPAFRFPLQQQQFLALGGQSRIPETEALGPQLQQSVHVYGSRLYLQSPPSLESRFEAPKVFSQSSEPQIKVPSVVPSQPQSITTSMPTFNSALQHQQYLAFGSKSNVPKARITHSQLQQPVRAFVPQLHERPSLRRHSISTPHTVTMLPQSSEPRAPSFEPSLKIPTVTRSRTQSSVSNVPAFGSALQQQQNFTFAGQSNVPTARPLYSRLRLPVRASVSQLYERSSLKRHSTTIPYTLTMLPRSDEPTSFEPPVPRIVVPQLQPDIKNVPAIGSTLQQQQSLTLGAQSNVPKRQALISQLEDTVRTHGSQSYEQMSHFRDVLPSSSDTALVAPRFGALETIPSQPLPLIPFGYLSQQHSLLPYDDQPSVPGTQFIHQSFQQNPSLVRPGFEAPNVPAILPSFESKIIVPKVPAYRPQLNKPIALSLPYLDLPKVSTVGPQLRPHDESAFRAVSLSPRTDTIFDVGNLRRTGSPELRRTDLRFADLVIPYEDSK